MNFLDHIPPIRFHSILCNVIINVESKILMLQYIYINVYFTTMILIFVS